MDQHDARHRFLHGSSLGSRHQRYNLRHMPAVLTPHVCASSSKLLGLWGVAATGVWGLSSLSSLRLPRCQQTHKRDDAPLWRCLEPVADKSHATLCIVEYQSRESAIFRILLPHPNAGTHALANDCSTADDRDTVDLCSIDPRALDGSTDNRHSNNRNPDNSSSDDWNTDDSRAVYSGTSDG